MQITLIQHRQRQYTYNTISARGYQIVWVPEFIDNALRYPGCSIEEILLNPGFLIRCEEDRLKWYSLRIQSPITADLLRNAALDPSQTLMEAYIGREVSCFSRLHHTTVPSHIEPEVQSILKSELIKRQTDYCVAGLSGDVLVAWYYYNYCHTFIRGSWHEVKSLVFNDYDTVSVETLLDPKKESDNDPWEYLRARPARDSDAASHSDLEKVLPAVLRILEKAPYGRMLERVFAGRITVKEACAELGYSSAWFSACVVAPVVIELRKELRNIGIVYRNCGKSDLRILRRCYLAAIQELELTQAPSILRNGDRTTFPEKFDVFTKY